MDAKECRREYQESRPSVEAGGFLRVLEGSAEVALRDGIAAAAFTETQSA